MRTRLELMRALMRTLPDAPGAWSEVDRQRFLAAVRACLSWLYPTTEEMRAEGLLPHEEALQETHA